MTETIYHYTTKKGAKAIEKSGIIKSSKSRTHAHYGQGVYATKMNPDIFYKDAIAVNNYGGRDATFLRALKIGKIDFAIKMKVPKGFFRKVSDHRNVWLHKGDWHLDDCIEWETLDVDDDEDDDSDEDEEDQDKDGEDQDEDEEDQDEEDSDQDEDDDKGDDSDEDDEDSDSDENDESSDSHENDETSDSDENDESSDSSEDYTD